jgi:uncharacterized protein YjbI with pentapeptide repeats
LSILSVVAFLVMDGRKGQNLSRDNLSGAYLSQAKYLTQSQLDAACAGSNTPPKNLPKDKDRNQLIWRGKACPEE